MNILLLEKRVARIERCLYSMNEARAAKANIFSKNIDDVKLAIDSGVDINSTDRYGRTPLQAACAQKEINVELIEYLLDNGANPNITDKKGVPYLTVFAKGCKTGLALNRKLLELFIEHGVSLKDGEYGDIPVLLWAMWNGIRDKLLLSLIDNGVVNGRSPIVNFRDVIGQVVQQYTWSSSGRKFDESVYSAIINKYISLMYSNGQLHDFFFTTLSGGGPSDRIIAEEIALKGTSYLFDAIMKYNIWPFVMCEKYGSGCLNDKLISKLYESAKNVTSSYYIYNIANFVSDVMWAGSKLNKPIDFISDMISTESLESNGSGIADLDNLYYMMLMALKSNNTKLLKALVNNGIAIIKKNKEYSNGRNKIIKYVATAPQSGLLDEETRLVCKVLNVLPDSDSIIIKRGSDSIGEELGKTHNVRLINWFVSNGYGRDIENSVSKEEMSDEVKTALEGDESVSKVDIIYNKRHSDDRYQQAKKLLNDDRYVRDISIIANQYPEFLTNAKFYNMAKELSSSSTNARLLIRYIDSSNRDEANGPNYDM